MVVEEIGPCKKSRPVEIPEETIKEMADEPRASPRGRAAGLPPGPRRLLG